MVEASHEKIKAHQERMVTKTDSNLEVLKVCQEVMEACQDRGQSRKDRGRGGAVTGHHA
jgi:hypothetical protein